MSDQRKPLAGIYRRQTGPLPPEEIHDFEDDWFNSDLPESTPTAERILEYLKGRRRLIERMARDLGDAEYQDPMSDARRAAKHAGAVNFQWDADTALRQIDAIAAMLDSGHGTTAAIDIQRMFIEAIKLGRTFERLYVRRFEYWAMLGRNAKGKGSALSVEEWILVCDAVARLAAETDANGKRKYKVPAARSEVLSAVRGGRFPGIAQPVDIGDEMLRNKYSKHRASQRAAGND